MAALSQKPTYLSITSLVCSEITGVTTQLRADARASVSSYMGASATIPRLQRSFKKARDVALHYGPDHDCMEYLEPFLETIRCEETTGVVTQRALSAVHCFLRAELLSLNPSSAPAAMVAVVKAATYCRFEVTDPAADEVRSPPPRPQGGWPPAAEAVEVPSGTKRALGLHSPLRHLAPTPFGTTAQPPGPPCLCQVVLMCILQLLVGCIECNAGAPRRSHAPPSRALALAQPPTFALTRPLALALALTLTLAVTLTLTPCRQSPLGRGGVRGRPLVLPYLVSGAGQG